MPRIPATDPRRALATFELQRGFRLELVAAEPKVVNPVDACFDESGRMYVAEMRDYPFSWEPTTLNPKGGGKKDAGTVRLLEDADGDGVFERSVIFADKLTWPTSVCCYNGGVFVLAPPHLHFLIDTDGDGVADLRRIVLTGFRRDNVQAIANNLKWSLDNRIVFAAGRTGGDLLRDGKKVFTIHGQDISLDPVTLAVSAVTGGEQFGLCFDDWGNRFVCNNSNHIEQVVFEERYVARNPYFPIASPIRTIAKEGASAPVFRRSPPEPWRVVRTRRRVSDPKMLRTLPHTEQFAAGYFTSAAGVTIYRGNAYPAAFRGNAFIGDVGGNLVHRKLLSREGERIIATRADQNTEFIASTDNWFRPVNFVNAPDGTLYLLDMYRETIEHPYSIPEDIKAHLDLQSGDDRGRIYRLVSAAGTRFSPRPLRRLSSAELAGQLESPNAWNRETAQRLLCQRRDRTVVRALEELAVHSSAPLARLHALYTLEGLKALSIDVLRAGLSAGEPRLRAHAVRLFEPWLRKGSLPAVFLASLADDPDPLVRFQVALSVGEADPIQAVDVLARVARHVGGDELLRSAIMTSVAHNADQLAGRLLADDRFLRQAESVLLLGDLASVVGAQPDRKRVLALLKGILGEHTPAATRLVMLRSLGQGLARRGVSLTTLFTEKGLDRDLSRVATAAFDEAAQVAADSARSEDERARSISVLGFAPSERALQVLKTLLTPQNSASLQSAAVAALTSAPNRDIGTLLLDRWKSFGPRVRRDVADALLRSSTGTRDLLDAVEAGRVGRGEIERDVKQILTSHPDSEIRRRSRGLFSAETATDRAKIIAAYRHALDKPSDVGRGRDLFQKHCAVCHRVGGVGHAVGPDLVSIQNKSPADMLVAVLDPNREAQPNYMAYVLVTDQGAIHSGIIAAESAVSVTLRRAEGKEEQILRSQIEELSSTGKSLMPDGFEKDISPAQMADLIAFVKSIKTKSAAP